MSGPWADANELELAACQLVWQNQGGMGEPPTEEAKAILAQVRERQMLVEKSAYEMMLRKTREGRWYPRRHMRLALFVFLPIMLVMILASVWLGGR